MRTLIVEDNLVNREFLMAVLEERAQCVAVETAEEALELVDKAWEQGEPFDLVFMDVLLPGMDGLQALERIRTKENILGLDDAGRIKVIVTTALDDDLDTAQPLFDGAHSSYVAKPLTIDKISRELKNFGLE